MSISTGLSILLDAFSPFGSDIQSKGWDAFAADKSGEPKFDHAIEERGYIDFAFQDIGGYRARLAEQDQAWLDSTQPYGMEMSTAYDTDIGTKVIRRLPFFENPRINESRSANYAETNVFMRNEPVRLYTGSQARKFDIDIWYTLPHLGAFYNNYYKRSASELDREGIADALAFFEETLRTDRATKSSTMLYDGNAGFVYAGEVPVGYKEGTAIANFGTGGTTGADGETADKTSVGDQGPRMPINTPVTLSEGDLPDGKGFFNAHALNSPAHGKIAGMIDYFMNIIRGCVISTVGMGTTDKSKYGPPVAYLNWGTVYNDVPCIVKSYKIEVDPLKAGMDNATFWSRMIRVKLQLEEFRQTDGIVNSGSNGVYGWNTIFSKGGIPRGDKGGGHFTR